MGEGELTQQPWRRIHRRKGTRRQLAVRFAPLRVCVANSLLQRVHDVWTQYLPDEEVSRAGKRRASDDRKHRLSNLPADTCPKMLVTTRKVRRSYESAHLDMERFPDVIIAR